MACTTGACGKKFCNCKNLVHGPGCNYPALNFLVQSCGVISCLIPLAHIVMIIAYFIIYPSVLNLIPIESISLPFLSLLLLFGISVYLTIIASHIACKASHLVASLAITCFMIWTLAVMILFALFLQQKSNAFESFISKHLHNSLKCSANDSDTYVAWQATQDLFECCGVSGTSDWGAPCGYSIGLCDSMSFGQQKPRRAGLEARKATPSVPDSCCKIKKKRPPTTTSKPDTTETTEGDTTPKPRTFLQKLLATIGNIIGGAVNLVGGALKLVGNTAKFAGNLLGSAFNLIGRKKRDLTPYLDPNGNGVKEFYALRLGLLLKLCQTLGMLFNVTLPNDTVVPDVPYLAPLNESTQEILRRSFQKRFVDIIGKYLKKDPIKGWTLRNQKNDSVAVGLEQDFQRIKNIPPPNFVNNLPAPDTGSIRTDQVPNPDEYFKGQFPEEIFPQQPDQSDRKDTNQNEVPLIGAGSDNESQVTINPELYAMMRGEQAGGRRLLFGLVDWLFPTTTKKVEHVLTEWPKTYPPPNIVTRPSPATESFMKYYHGPDLFQLRPYVYYREACNFSPNKNNANTDGCLKKILQPLYNVGKYFHDAIALVTYFMVLLFVLKSFSIFGAIESAIIERKRGCRPGGFHTSC